MSGIALLRLLKPLEYYREKYGTPFYGLNKMYLLMEKQHNRGQDGAGLASIKFDMMPGERFISRTRSKDQQPIQDIFSKINTRINSVVSDLWGEVPEDELKRQVPYLGELYLGHVLYSAKSNPSIEDVHPFLRQNNWMHRNLILAGNFHMTNVPELFDYLVNIGQHPKEKSDTVTILEKIGHYLDSEVEALYKKVRVEGVSKIEASEYIVQNIDLTKILRSSTKDFDGGYTIAGLLGHGDAFVVRDPNGIRPAYYYVDDEIVVVSSERPPIQTTFNIKSENILELEPGSALIIKKSGQLQVNNILPPKPLKSCSFERIYFARGNDFEIYQERKTLGKILMPEVLKAINYDTINSVFSYIPNTAETSFLGMLEGAQDELNRQKNEAILQERKTLSEKRLTQILSHRIRTEKIAVKDVKLRTFITEDTSRNDLVAHVYDVTYGVVKPTDNLVVIDDSIVRGTTLRESILGMLDRLNPQKIIVVSSAPQIRYPDCYGVDLPRFDDFIAFQAAVELLVENKLGWVIDEVYRKCIQQVGRQDEDIKNHIKEIYAPFTDEQISDKIAQMLSRSGIKAELKVIYQTVEKLHEACPKTTGDWYFTGDYPTPGGNRFANRAYIEFYEKKKNRVH